MNPMAVDKSEIVVQFDRVTVDHAFNMPDHVLFSFANGSEFDFFSFYLQALARLSQEGIRRRNCPFAAAFAL